MKGDFTRNIGDSLKSPVKFSSLKGNLNNFKMFNFVELYTSSDHCVILCFCLSEQWPKWSLH